MFEYIVYAIEIIVHVILIILLQKEAKRNKYVNFLILFNISIIIWIFSILLIAILKHDDSVIWLARGTFLATSLSATSFVCFFRTSLTKKLDLFSKIYAIAGLIVGIFSLSPHVVDYVDMSSNEMFPAVKFGSFSFVYMIFIVLGLLNLLFTMFTERKNIKGLQLLRNTYITTGLIIAGIIALFTNMILPILSGSSASAFWGPVGVSSVSILASYSYANLRLFSIKFVVNYFLYSMILVLSQLGFFVLVLYLIEKYGIKIFSPSGILIITIAISLVTILVRKYAERMKEFFLNNLFISAESLKKEKEIFDKQISTELNLEKLGIFTLLSISRIFKIDKVGIVIFDKENASVTFKKLKGWEETRFDLRSLLQSIYYWDKMEHSTILIKEEIRDNNSADTRLSKILKFMEECNVEVIFPLNRKVQLNGVIVLGEKLSKIPYTREEISFLEQLLLSSSVAFGRAILYSEVQTFNKTLQTKVDEQTKELQIKVKELQEARRKESDMIDIMGHELRTPATVVKLNAQLLEKFINSNPEEYKKYVDRIKIAIENEIKLINTLLSSAKLEGDKIELNPEDIDILNEIDMAINGQEPEANQKHLKIINNPNPNTPHIYADKARTVEVLNNLINNAIKYTEKGSISIQTSFNDNYVKIAVIDTGRGIPKEEIPSLGQKFHRINQYLTDDNEKVSVVRPGGTGLGLYVTFNLVKKMGGDIKVESEIGKGSIFSFVLPRYKGQASSNIQGSNMFERLGLKK